MAQPRFLRALRPAIDASRLAVCVTLTIVGLAALAGWGIPETFATQTSFALGSVVLVLVALLLCAAWPTASMTDTPPSHVTRLAGPWVVAAIGLGAAVLAAGRALPVVFAGRINAYEADMLVVIENGIARLLDGANPYALYHVPWEAPLPYGPLLWLPYVLPHVLGVDPRVLGLTAQLVVPGALVWAACECTRGGQRLTATFLLALAVTWLLYPPLLQFVKIGHTAVYWPLLLVFFWLLRSDRWTAACLAAGALVAARTTMVALIPVFVIYLYCRRELTAARVALIAAAATVWFVPFAVADPDALQYALYGSYQKVMKTHVWVATNWAQNTFGLTGWLLRRGLQRFVETAQIVTMLGVYALSARALKRGARPEPWLALALLAFSMTTVWPVRYIYFDVFVALASGLACHVLAAPARARGLVRTLTLLVAAGLIIVLGMSAVRWGSTSTVDIGTPAGAAMTGGGFGQDVGVRDGDRTFVWVEGELARVRLPRAGWSGATIHLSARAADVPGAPQQHVSAVLNGHRLGHATLGEEWADVTFRAPRKAWYYGFNLLELHFSWAVAGSDTRDPRRLSAAVDAIRVGE